MSRKKGSTKGISKRALREINETVVVMMMVLPPDRMPLQVDGYSVAIDISVADKDITAEQVMGALQKSSVADIVKDFGFSRSQRIEGDVVFTQVTILLACEGVDPDKVNVELFEKLAEDAAREFVRANS